MRNRERQQWTEYVRRMEERRDKKPRKSRAKKRRAASQAELDAALDDLIRAAQEKLVAPQVTGGVVALCPLLRRPGKD
jgi:hypothetical protein